jgi:hypothetical protein
MRIGVLIHFNGVVETSVGVVTYTGLSNREIGVRFLAAKEDFSLPLNITPVLGFTQLPTE